MFYTNSTTSQMIGVTGGIVPVPKWSTRQQNISVAATTNVVARSSVGEEDHIERHLDTLTSTDTFRPDEGPDELNSEHLTKLAELTKNRRLNSTSTNTNTAAIVDNRTAANNMTMNTNVMPTPLACSRSSSLTSLSSFDAKSVHSSVASEYSVAVVAASSTSAAANLQQIVNGGRRKKSSSSSNSSSSSTSCEKNNRNASDDEETAGEEETEKDNRKRRTLLSSDMPTTVRKSEQERREVEDSSDEEDNWEEDLTTDSPTAAAESSFIRRSRAQHLQQQQFYRQTAALQQQLVTNSLVPPPVLPPTTNKPLPWQQATTVPTLPIDYHQLNSNMSRLNIGQPTAIATTTSSILATKTVNLPISGSPIEQQTPKFLQFQQQQQQVTTVNPMQPASSTVVAPTMSVTYAFMKGQQQPQTTTYNQPILPIQPPIVAPPALQPQPPRFLSSAPPTNNQFYMQPAHHMVHPHHHTHHHHQPHLLAPPPSSPIVNPSPSSSALSNDAIHRFYDSTSLSSADPHLKSVNTSPQESVCSHRSTTSTLSIVKNDNMQFMQQPPVYSRNFEKFSALLNKAHMNTRQNRVEIEPEEYGSRDYPAIMMMGGGSGSGGVGPSPLIIGGGAGGPLSSSSSSSSSSGKSQIMANPHRLPQQHQHQHQPAIMQQLAPPQPQIQPKFLWAQSYTPPQINMPLINKTNILPPPLLAPEEHNDSTAVDDYEEFNDFFRENLRPKSELPANAPKIGPNTSLDENDFKPARNSFKRSSLQSLDSISLSASRQSTVASNNTPTKKRVETKKTAVVSSKPAPPKPVESSKPPQKSTGISSAPIVNMTRTAQLRASKQQQLKNSIDKNKPQLKTKPTGLNQTSQLDSSRRVSIGSSAAVKRDLNTTKQSTVNVAPKLPVSASKQVISRPTPTTNSTARQIAKPKLTTMTTTTTKST